VTNYKSTGVQELIDYLRFHVPLKNFFIYM
jgi:hypothetical protein